LPGDGHIQEDIQAELAKHGIKNVEIKQVLSPAWTSEWMSESGREKTQGYGIAAPASHSLFDGEDQPNPVPSAIQNIEMISRFGSTACKALYRCLIAANHLIILNAIKIRSPCPKSCLN
jgi:ring-1,2-phenylacetyl-CoA epoxidase subunit PaaD